ncbi:right-handed parallel beta-helix repeat-containing protein [Mameliella alba]|uniref:Periplasmic copper-binding protein NosD beta helix domain-containing protein n=1 Tax=Mameliella alba TaxID=561184 RepID=A0A0B3RSV4_9RHOB|nr:right-handed parallel beta-helix repeat-containing protein [Mameliella alba]KHQ51087.1 hypothetical protein OA50_04458 [Mameliella alba]
MTWDASTQTITRIWDFATNFDALDVAPRSGFDAAFDDVVDSVNAAIADHNSKFSPTYSDRAAAVAANVPASAKALHVMTPTGERITFVRNTRGSAGAALTTNSGSYEWMPAVPWMVTPDHWAENTNQGTTDMKTAIQSAVDYVEDLSGTGVYLSGGRVNILNANYLTSGEIRVNDHGVHFYGVADDTGSRISNSSGTSNTILFRPDSPLTGGTLEGGGIHNITFWNTHSGSNPSAGAHVEVDSTARVQIINCSFYNHYRGIKFSGSGQGCTVAFCHITQGSNTSTAVTAGSAGIYVGRRQVNAGVRTPALDGSNYYTECNGLDIIGCEIISNNYGMQDCIHIDSCDGVKLIGGHTNGAIRSCLCLAPAQDNISFSDFHAVGHHFDPLPGTTQDGVTIEDFASAGGSAMRDISFTGCSFSGASRDLMRIVMQCKNITVTGNNFKVAGDHHVVVNSADAQGIILTSNTMYKSDQDAVGNVPAIYLAAGDDIKVKDNVIDTGTRGIQFLSAATGVNITDNTFSNMTETDILPPDGVPVGTVIGANKVSASQTVASATTVVLYPGIISFRFTGTTTVNTIRAAATGTGPTIPNCCWDGRVVTIRATSSFTVSSSAGNIRLTGGVDFPMADGDRLVLEYDDTDNLWYEVGRSQGKHVSTSQVTINNTTADVVGDYAIATDEVHEWTVMQRSSGGTIQGKWHVTVDDDGTTVTGLVSEIHDASTEVAVTVTDNADGTYTINGQNTAANDKYFVARLDSKTEWAN